MSPRHDPADPIAVYEATVARNYRWNAAVFLLYGLLGTTGWRLITAPTFVPDYLYRLGGSNLTVGIVLFCGGIGRFLSPLAGASYATHRPLVKGVALGIGGGLRLQVLGMALAALYLPPSANLTAFFVFYCLFNVLVGFQGVVFGLLLAKVIPLARRGRFIGVRDFAGGATAAGVALLAVRFLREMAFPASYGLTYLVAFVFTALGLVCIAALREPRSPVSPDRRSLVATLAGMRMLLRSDASFAWYCVARGLGALALMAAPFFIIALGQVPGRSPTDLAHATVAYFTASTLGNLCWGQVADRAGFRTVFLLAATVWLGALTLALVPGVAAIGPITLFVLVGAGQGGIQMAALNLVYEFGDDVELGMRLALVNALGELMVAIAPLVGGAIADRWSYAALYGVASGFTALAAAAMYLRVPPRGRRGRPALRTRSSPPAPRR
jgi:MFS family permease